MKIGLIVDKKQEKKRVRTQQRVILVTYLLCHKFKVVSPEDIYVLSEYRDDYTCIDLTHASRDELYLSLSKVINNKKFTKDYKNLLVQDYGRRITYTYTYDYCLVVLMLSYGLERTYEDLVADVLGTFRLRDEVESSYPLKDIIELIVARKIDKSKAKLQLDEECLEPYKYVCNVYNIDYKEELFVRDYYDILRTHSIRKYAEEHEGFDIKVPRNILVKLSNKLTICSILDDNNAICKYIKYMLSPYFIYSEYYHIHNGKDYLLYNTLCSEYGKFLYSNDKEFKLWEYWRDKLRVSHHVYDKESYEYDSSYSFFKTKFKRKKSK